MDIRHLSSNLNEIEVSPDEIYLDIHNPRFYSEKFPIASNADPLDMKLQERIRKFIEDKYSISDIMGSIHQVGFLQMDRVVVREFKGKYYCIRR